MAKMKLSGQKPFRGAIVTFLARTRIAAWICSFEHGRNDRFAGSREGRRNGASSDNPTHLAGRARICEGTRVAGLREGVRPNRKRLHQRYREVIFADVSLSHTADRWRLKRGALR
jgi:hypothetical protein